MQTALRVTTRVLPGHRVEIVAPALIYTVEQPLAILDDVLVS